MGGVSEVDRDRTGLAPEDPDAPGDGQLEALRRLLLEPEQAQIRSILARLDDPTQHAREVGDILPRAVFHASGRGDELEEALTPTLERSTHRAIRRDRQAFAEALFPVMGPAIRRAIAEALRSLIQGLNQALEHSLSVRGLRWRVEALRTGRSFGEIVLAKTLVYRVEQLFLIHRSSGLLLQHLIAPEVQAQDADMVSGMLTAIQDFVRDSFQVGHEETLASVEVGDLQVWVEQGPHAVLAAAIRGDAPVELRQTMREALETLHLDLRDDLASFDGDSAPFEAARPLLEGCLQSQREIPEKRTSPWLWLLLALLIGWVAWWSIAGWQEHRRTRALLRALRAEPGIVVTEVLREGGRLQLRGLRDPLAGDPAALAAVAGFDADRVALHFAPYHALHPPFVLARARTALHPPPQVHLELDGGRLLVSGSASERWLARLRDVAPLLAGVDAVDDAALEVVDEATAVDRLMVGLADRIASRTVRFATGSAAIAATETATIDETVADVTELVRLAEERFAVVRIEVEGHADPTGPPELNIRLSRDRAAAVAGALVEGGVPSSLVAPVGRGTLLPSEGAEARDGQQLQELRKVSFSVDIRRLRDKEQATP